MSGKKPATCKSCGALLIFALTANGKRMPLDKTRDFSGTSRYAIHYPAYGPPVVRTLGPGEEPRPGVEHRHMPHHATCAGRQVARCSPGVQQIAAE